MKKGKGGLDVVVKKKVVTGKKSMPKKKNGGVAFVFGGFREPDEELPVKDLAYDIEKLSTVEDLGTKDALELIYVGIGDNIDHLHGHDLRLRIREELEIRDRLIGSLRHSYSDFTRVNGEINQLTLFLRDNYPEALGVGFKSSVDIAIHFLAKAKRTKWERFKRVLRSMFGMSKKRITKGEVE